MKQKNLGITCILILAALIVCFPVASLLSNPSTYSGTFASIDNKMENVLSLTAACTVVSSAITAAPDDIATPIATQLAEYTDYLLIIFSILLTEKYILTIIGLFSFRLVVPAALICEIPTIKNRWHELRNIVLKIAVFCVSLYLVIPVSMGVSDRIAQTYDVSVSQTIAAAEALAQDEQEAEDWSLESAWSKFTGTISSVTDTVTHIPQKVSEMMNRFIQSIAVMIVTSCIIPLLVLAFFLWLVKVITGREIHVAPPARRREKPLHQGAENRLTDGGGSIEDTPQE